MRYLRIAALCVALLFVYTQADAQAPWTWTSVTGNNGSVILPYANTPTFDGAAIATGDWIGGFGTNNLFCVGAVLWEVGQPPQLANGLTVWGDDDQTLGVDGLVAGEIIQYRLFRLADGLEYIATSVTYAAGSSNTTGAYLVNGFWVIGAMTFIGNTPPTYTISGTITYANVNNTVMTNTNVALVSGELVIATTTTDASGNYAFENVEDGTYTIVASTDKTWGGSNNTDAILVKRHVIAYQGFQFNAIQLKAADVQNNNIVNNTDAILIQRKVVGGNVSQWTLPNWVFEKPTVLIEGANAISNIKALCAGDVNGSYTPPL